jgi:hypothetical protein
MDWRERLAENLTSESKAYGYTLTVWGTGAILINQYSTPDIVEFFLYIGGGLLGFGVLGLLAFRELFAREQPEGNDQLIVASTVHILGTGGALVVGYLLARLISLYPSLPEAAGFLLLGFQATVVYNLLLLVESSLVRITPFVDADAEE